MQTYTGFIIEREKFIFCRQQLVSLLTSMGSTNPIELAKHIQKKARISWMKKRDIKIYAEYLCEILKWYIWGE